MICASSMDFDFQALHGAVKGAKCACPRRPARLPRNHRSTGALIVGSTGGRKLGILRSVAANVIPRCLRTDEDVHFNLNTWIAVNGTQSDPVHFTLVDPTERGPTGLAEA